jgi:superkiller protein 3
MALLVLTVSINAQESAEDGLKKGYELSSNGSDEKALLAYENAISIDPKNANAWINKANTLYQLNRTIESDQSYQRALEITEGMLANDSENVTLWIGKGLLLNNLGNAQEAVAAFDNASDIDPQNEMAWKMKGVLFASDLQRYDEALAAFDRALQINQEDTAVWKLKGDSLVALGLQSEAEAAYAKARELGYSNASQTLENSAEDWFNKGQEHFRNGSKEEAIKAYDKAIEINPQYGMAWGGKATALSLLGRHNESLDAFNEAIETWPANDTERISELWAFKGNTLQMAGRPKEAFEAYDEAIRIYPQNFDAWMWKGDSLENLGQYNESLLAYNKAIDAVPPQMPEIEASAQTAKGDLLLKIGRYEEAYESYNRTVELNTTVDIDRFYSAWSWRGIGNALAGLERYNESLQAFNKSMELYPESAFQAWRDEGNVLTDMGKDELAIDAYNKSIEMAPSEFELSKALIRKGKTLDEIGKHDEAVKTYEIAVNNLDKTLQQSPLDAETWYLKGTALKALGHNADADAASAKAKELGYQE